MAKIIIVEDDPVLQKTLEEYLTADGFEVFCAGDGEEGLRIIRKEIPDLVLLDVILPKMDGYEVIKAVKSGEKTKQIPVVLLTNLGGVRDVEKALELGATTYLIKSDYKLEEVVKKVRDIIAKK